MAFPRMEFFSECFSGRSCISLIFILLMRNYTASPRSFHCKAADGLLIRPKGDWTGTFTYSTTAMNYKTLLDGLARLLLHNHEPDFQVFIRAVNSQCRLFSHDIRGGKKRAPSATARVQEGSLDMLLTLQRNPSADPAQAPSGILQVILTRGGRELQLFCFHSHISCFCCSCPSGRMLSPR